MYYVSPRYSALDFPQPMTIDNAITIFEDQVHGWFLDVCRTLKDDVIADYVVLMVVTSYFEMIEMFYQGVDSDIEGSKKIFKDGFFRVVASPFGLSNTQSNEIADQLYVQMRCGFYHAGMPRSGIVLSRQEQSFLSVELEPGKKPRSFKFNVPQILEYVVRDFREYMKVLRNPQNKEQREKFRIAWNLRVKGSEALTIPNP
jgi:hypothetical protein